MLTVKSTRIFWLHLYLVRSMLILREVVENRSIDGHLPTRFLPADFYPRGYLLTGHLPIDFNPMRVNVTSVNTNFFLNGLNKKAEIFNEITV